MYSGICFASGSLTLLYTYKVTKWKIDGNMQIFSDTFSILQFLDILKHKLVYKQHILKEI